MVIARVCAELRGFPSEGGQEIDVEFAGIGGNTNFFELNDVETQRGRTVFFCKLWSFVEHVTCTILSSPSDDFKNRSEVE